MVQHNKCVSVLPQSILQIKQLSPTLQLLGFQVLQVALCHLENLEPRGSVVGKRALQTPQDVGKVDTWNWELSHPPVFHWPELSHAAPSELQGRLEMSFSWDPRKRHNVWNTVFCPCHSLFRKIDRRPANIDTIMQRLQTFYLTNYLLGNHAALFCFIFLMKNVSLNFPLSKIQSCFYICDQILINKRM